MKKTGSTGYVYDFTVDYIIVGHDILDIYKYLIRKSNITWHDTYKNCLDL